MRALLISAIASLLAAPAAADIRIRDDAGGVLSVYAERIEAARASRERVIIDGRCASACTLYLTLPSSQICATPRGLFIFHAATDAQFGLPDWRANDALMRAWPPHVQIAIGRRGGLWLNPVTISARELVPACGRR